MEAGIFNILSNDAGVGAICGDRIYPNAIPQDALVPAITYQRISIDPDDTKDGVSTLDNIDVDIDAWADDFSDVISLADAIRTALDRKAEGTYGGDTFQSIQFETEVSLFVEIPEQPRYHITQTYKVREKL